MKSNKLILIVAMLIIVAIIVSIGATINETVDPSAIKEWYDDTKEIVLGCGKIDEYQGINSIDAIKENYDNGIRAFEMDLSLTSDSKVVLRKDWTTFSGQENLNINSEGTYVPTLDEFKNDKIYGKYTPTSLEDVINMMDQYKDMYIVIDISSTEQKDVVAMYTEIVNEFKEKGKIKYLDRVIVQLYNKEMLDDIETVCSFKNYIFKITQDDIDDVDSVIDFCNKRAIKAVSVDWYSLETVQGLQDKLSENKLSYYVYDVDNKESAIKYINNGASGIFTNSLENQDLNSNNIQGEDNENKE